MPKKSNNNQGISIEALELLTQAFMEEGLSKTEAIVQATQKLQGTPEPEAEKPKTQSELKRKELADKGYTWRPGKGAHYRPADQETLLRALGYEFKTDVITNQTIYKATDGKWTVCDKRELTQIARELANIEDRVSFYTHRQFLQGAVDCPPYHNQIEETICLEDLSTYADGSYTRKLLDIMSLRDEFEERIFCYWLTQCVVGWCHNEEGKKRLGLCPVLFTAQHQIGKSSLIKILMRPWEEKELTYTTSATKIDPSDRHKFMSQLRSGITEIAEMHQFASKQDMAALKDYVTKPFVDTTQLFTDDTRVWIPRRNSLLATTNVARCLYDKSGSTRFPVLHPTIPDEGGRFHYINLATLTKEDIIGVFREAEYRYRQHGDRAYIPTREENIVIEARNAEHQVHRQGDKAVMTFFDGDSTYRTDWISAKTVQKALIMGGGLDSSGKPISPFLNALKPQNITAAIWDDAMDTLVQDGIVRKRVRKQGKYELTQYRFPPVDPLIQEEWADWMRRTQTVRNSGEKRIEKLIELFIDPEREDEDYEKIADKKYTEKTGRDHGNELPEDERKEWEKFKLQYLLSHNADEDDAEEYAYEELDRKRAKEKAVNTMTELISRTSDRPLNNPTDDDPPADTKEPEDEDEDKDEDEDQEEEW